MVAVVERIGPFDKLPDTSHRSGWYSEDRGLERITQELAQSRFYFSFVGHLRHIVQAFPSEEAINILEGGCGEARACEDIKNLACSFGKEIHTTGITMAERNVEKASSRVDRLLVGSIQECFARGRLQEESIHFILDFCGAAFSDAVSYKEDEWYPSGAHVVPIYQRLLVPGGSALLALVDLLESSGRMTPRRQQTLELLDENNIDVLYTRGVYVLVEKRS